MNKKYSRIKSICDCKIAPMNQFNIIIPDRLIGQRIDSAMAQMLPDYSRSKITTWVRSGGALINGKTF